MNQKINKSKLVGKKVFLREMRLDDASSIVKWRNDSEIRKWMFNQEELTTEKHLNWFKSKKNRIDFMICDILTQIPIGTLNYINIDNHTAEAGKMLGEKDFWGGGYAKEAFLMWLHIGFDSFNFSKIYVRTMATNKANIGLNRKLGFEDVSNETVEVHNEKEVGVLKMEIDKIKLKENV